MLCNWLLNLIFELYFFLVFLFLLDRIYFDLWGIIGGQGQAGSKGQVRVQLPSSGEWAAGSLLYLISEMSMMVR